MARPPKLPDERRDARLSAPRLTASELALVEADAAIAGLGLAEYVRRRVLGQRVAPARLLIELNRVGART